MTLDDAIDRIYPLLHACVPGSEAHDYWFNQLRGFQVRAAEELGKRLRASRQFDSEAYRKTLGEFQELAKKYGIPI